MCSWAVGSFALLATAAASFGQAGVPGYSVEARWVITALDGAATLSSTAGGQIIGSTPNTSSGNPSIAIPATGATAILLTLQVRTVFNFSAQSQFPADSATVRYGNFGPVSFGYGPQGAIQPTTITRSGATAGTAFARGDWGNYINGINPDTGDFFTYTGMMRGAAPGLYNPTTWSFRRGFRGHGPLISSDFDNATGNGAGVNDSDNGMFDSAGDLRNINLLRSDFHSGPQHTRFTPGTQFNNLSDVVPPNLNLNTAPWFDTYRVLLTSDVPLVLGEGLDVTYEGWVYAGYRESSQGGVWHSALQRTLSGPVRVFRLPPFLRRRRVACSHLPASFSCDAAESCSARKT